jgi:hypothetical protein
MKAIDFREKIKIFAVKLIICVGLNIWWVYSSPLTDVMPAGSYGNFFLRIEQSRKSPSPFYAMVFTIKKKYI